MMGFEQSRLCPKCGGELITAFFHQEGEWPKSCQGLKFEHIDRHCQRCHYEWAELPRDATWAPEAKP